MSKSTEQRIKHRLKEISQESKVPFNSLLDVLFLERFLVRISKSDYSDKLIFKGGMCLAQIIDLGRETKDIDFLLQEMKGGIDKVKTVLEEIATQSIDDGFFFKDVNVLELSIEHKKYPGYRIIVQGELGQIKNKVSIDIGVGDIVRPQLLTVELMSSNGAPLFEDSIDLKSYPSEYIFSEKFEAILYLSEINGRIKDFYDCYRLIKENKLDKGKLKTAIAETLNNRETKFSLIPEPAGQLKIRWKSFVKKQKVEGLDLDLVVQKINHFLEGTCRT